VVVAGAGAAVVVWLAAMVPGVRNPPEASLPDRADAVIVFAGEGPRFVAARQLAANGLTGVLVLSAPDLPEVAQGWCDEVDPGPFEIRCVVPDPENTRGESRMFADLADVEGWEQLVAVTSASHAQRALTTLEQCFPGEVTMVPVASRPAGVRQVVGEVLATAATQTVARTC
jgi:uncharacterized SAM-binding protein YcdF (DUF218 family)